MTAHRAALDTRRRVPAARAGRVVLCSHFSFVHRFRPGTLWGIWDIDNSCYALLLLRVPTIVMGSEERMVADGRRLHR